MGGSILQLPFRRNRKQHHKILQLFNWIQNEQTNATKNIKPELLLLPILVGGGVAQSRSTKNCDTERSRDATHPLLGACVCLLVCVCVWLLWAKMHITFSPMLFSSVLRKLEDAPATKLHNYFKMASLHGVLALSHSLSLYAFGFVHLVRMFAAHIFFLLLFYSNGFFSVSRYSAFFRNSLHTHTKITNTQSFGQFICRSVYLLLSVCRNLKHVLLRFTR